MTTARDKLSPFAVARRTTVAWQRLAPFLGTSRWGLLALAACSVAAGLSEALLLGLVASMGTALSQGDSEVLVDLGPVQLDAALNSLILVGLGLAVLRGVLAMLLAYLPARMSAAAMAAMRKKLFGSFTRTSWSVQAAERDGHFQSLMSTHVSNASQAVVVVGTGISAALMFATLLASAFVFSIPTAIALIVASGLLFVALVPLSRRLRKSAKALSTEFVEYSKGVQEIVLMAEETQVFGASDAFRDSIHQQVDQVRGPLFRTRFLTQAVPNLFQSIAYVVLVLALAFVSLLDATGIAELGAVVLILVRALSYGQQLQAAATRMDELLPFMDRLRTGIDHYEESPQQNGDEPLAGVERLGMSDVGFAYVPGAPVLDGVDFEVRRGEALGIVGPSGAGKSSIVQLLLRLRDPDQGSLRVNGSDARTFRRADWQRRVAYVPQTSQLIWGTVAENIRFYRPDLTDQEVIRAARRAHVHDEIMSWPEGYDTVIGQRASAVSGGQRQRLCIARALAGDPDVLILDEPTSALDLRSELAVQQSLAELKGEVIMLLVAHRLSTLSVCDRVMVVVGGRVEAIGSREQLEQENDFYRQVTDITRQQSTL